MTLVCTLGGHRVTRACCSSATCPRVPQENSGAPRGMRLADVLRDACSICHILVPTAIANGLEYLPVLIGIAFVGHGTSAAAADQLTCNSMFR